MVFAILIYGDEAITDCLPEQEYEETLGKHQALQNQMSAQNRFIASAKLMPSSSAVVVKGQEPTLVTDGPFAESKEQFVGFYLLECEDLDSAIEATRRLPLKYHKMEVRPVDWLGGQVVK